MKRLLSLSVLFGFGAIAAYAGGLSPAIEVMPEVVNEGVEKRDLIFPLILLGLLALAVASRDGGGGGYDY